MKKRVVDGVIGIGSNSTRMLVCPKGKPLRIIDRGYSLTRLFEGLDKGNQLSKESILRTIQAILHMHNDAYEKYYVNRFWIFATSALRDAINRNDIIQTIYQTTGKSITIISGEEEAYYSFIGAGAGTKGKYGVIDIGGGSTEIAYGSQLSYPKTSSLQLGAMRLLKKYPKATFQDLEGILEDVKNHLSIAKPIRLLKNTRWIGVGGTFTTLKSLFHKKGIYPPKKQIFYKDQVYVKMKDLFSLPVPQRELYPNMPKGRGDITPYGFVVLYVLMDELKIPYVEVGNKGNLDGWLIVHSKDTMNYL